MGNPESGPEYLWFLDALVQVRVAYADGVDGISALDFRAPFGTAPPLHVYHTQDEVFHVLDGEVTWRIGSEDVAYGPGDTVLAPKEIRTHTALTRATAPDGWPLPLAETSRDSFERSPGRPTAPIYPSRRGRRAEPWPRNPRPAAELMATRPAKHSLVRRGARSVSWERGLPDELQQRLEA